MPGLKNNTLFWNKFFVICYNMLGIVGIHACIYGQKSIFAKNSILLTEQDFTQAVVVAMTVLFFTASYLLIIRNKAGIVIPAFLLSFIITGGYVVLAPLLVGHLAYYTSPKMQEHFSHTHRN